MAFREFTRSDRMSAQILRIVAVAVREEFEYDKELKHVAISDVDVSKDLSIATVYFNTLFPEYHQEALVILEKNAPFIRSIVAQKIRARRVPELRFVYDASLERGANLEALIDQARDSDPHFEEEE
ncbi:Ribosome-binding factor A [hydrothermal vent metagenome]|uniref:Ribosome-binding factor A n=1 Tax=hydrothermal vent metagenome TaxID=652676 RepID=A0A3B0V5P1_9ZZZZ